MYEDGKISLVHDENDKVIFCPIEDGKKSSCVYEYN